mmetsp:Transcript_15815/g.49076  ORF Transcript_15815/g.49076 Transcript_15815/m.49076 type:complete len:226 (+) Transcript_15815:224-901(+)
MGCCCLVFGVVAGGVKKSRPTAMNRRQRPPPPDAPRRDVLRIARRGSARARRQRRSVAAFQLLLREADGARHDHSAVGLPLDVRDEHHLAKDEPVPSCALRRGLRGGTVAHGADRESCARGVEVLLAVAPQCATADGGGRELKRPLPQPQLLEDGEVQSVTVEYSGRRRVRGLEHGQRVGRQADRRAKRCRRVLGGEERAAAIPSRRGARRRRGRGDAAGGVRCG